MTGKLDIPDKWIAGYLLGHPGSTVADAVRHWQEQRALQAQADREMRARIRKRLTTVPPIGPYRKATP